MLLLILAIQAAGIFWTMQRQRRVDPDPRSYPYVFKDIYSVHRSSNLFIPNVHFSSDTVSSLVEIKYSFPRIDVAERNPAFGARSYLRSVGMDMYFAAASPVDVDEDSLDELLYNLPYPLRSQDRYFSMAMDSLKAGFIGLQDSNYSLETLKKPVSWTGTDSVWSSNFRVLRKFHGNRGVATDSFFYLVENGFHDYYSERFLHVFRKGRPPKLVRTIHFPTPLSQGCVYRDRQGRWHLLLGCSTPCNNVRVPMKPVISSHPESVDTLDDCRATVYNLDERGNLLWATTFDEGGGATKVHVTPNLNDPLMAVFQRYNFIGDEKPAAVVVRIDRETGELLERNVFEGTFCPLKGPAAEEVDIVGGVFSDDRGVILLNDQGRQASVLKLENSLPGGGLYALRMPNGKIGITVQFHGDRFVVVESDGHALALIDAEKILDVNRFQIGRKGTDYLGIERGDQVMYGALVSDGADLWWLWRMRSYIALIVLPPALILGLFYFIRFNILRSRSRRQLARAYHEMEERVRQRTGELANTNLELEMEVDQRSQAQRELKRQSEHLTAILDSVHEGILTVDSHQRITRANRAFCQMFQLDPDQVQGQRIDRVRGGNLAQLGEVVRDTIEQNTRLVDHTIEVIDGPQGNRVVRINSAPLSDESPTFREAILVVRDVTTLHQLERQVVERYRFHNIIGRSPEMQEIYRLLEDLRETDSTVLITGESGTGKELVGAAIHYNSPRANGPFIRVNCGALSESLLESELFGHVKGAYTGAVRDRMGRFEAARGGTIFLDEIGDISNTMQVKLLRVLQEGEFERVGETKTIKTDARVIAATNSDLAASIEKGRFRQDLYYRLNVVSVKLPPLRRRQEDIPLLIDHFLQIFNEKLGKHVERVDDGVMDTLMRYAWPGNVRQLENCLNRAMIVCHGDTLLVEHLPDEIVQEANRIGKTSEREKVRPARRVKLDRENVLDALERCDWVVSRAARDLGISRNYLYLKMKHFEISREK